MAEGLRNITFQIDGSLVFTSDRNVWPRRSDNNDVLDCFQFTNIEGVTFTSSTRRGELDGSGEPWWGAIKCVSCVLIMCVLNAATHGHGHMGWAADVLYPLALSSQPRSSPPLI